MKSPSKTRQDLHLPRKISHFLSAPLLIAIIFRFELTYQQARWFLTIFSLTGLSIEIARMLFPRFNNLVLLIGGKIMREHESRAFTGASFYAIGMALSFWVFPYAIAIISCFCLAVADPTASMIGLRYGRRKITKGKSVAGTFACFLSSFLCIGLSLWFVILPLGLLNYNFSSPQLLATASIGAIFCALGELFSGKLDDNLTIPLMAGTGISIAIALFF